MIISLQYKIHFHISLYDVQCNKFWTLMLFSLKFNRNIKNIIILAGIVYLKHVILFLWFDRKSVVENRLTRLKNYLLINKIWFHTFYIVRVFILILTVGKRNLYIWLKLVDDLKDEVVQCMRIIKKGWIYKTKINLTCAILEKKNTVLYRNSVNDNNIMIQILNNSTPNYWTCGLAVIHSQNKHINANIIYIYRQFA